MDSMTHIQSLKARYRRSSSKEKFQNQLRESKVQVDRKDTSPSFKDSKFGAEESEMGKSNNSKSQKLTQKQLLMKRSRIDKQQSYMTGNKVKITTTELECDGGQTERWNTE